LKGVIEYIHYNYSNSISNKELASLVNLDQRYFIKLFKKGYSQTPQNYILAYRIFKASNLLNDGFSVAQVSEMVGFSDSKAFSRAFKRVKGISPSGYKKSYFGQP
jgi:transcriptional regulator GlxA family with amidase domain